MARLQDGSQSALNPKSAAADELAGLAQLLLSGGAVLFMLVMALAAWALFARPARRAWMTTTAFIVVPGVVVPVVVLTALLLRTFAPGSFTGLEGEPAVRVEVIGEQWWWRVQYLDARGEVDFVTANEVRIPAGRPVDLALRSADVIHSFWVPNLAGKVDMIPGRINRLRLSARETGRFRGQCAEYCGGPHAQMALHVIAESPATFETWRAHQRGATSAGAAEVARGAQLFVERGCGVCHAVRGTAARGIRGPDLTHVASRIALAAEALPNGRNALRDWVHSSQRIKPGNLMPSFDMLAPGELDAIADYLGSLR